MKDTGQLEPPTARPDEIGALDQLLDEVRGLKTRERILKICEMVIRFPELAPFNAMLVYMQRPNATLVLGAKEWADIGRHPKDAANPIVILRPFVPVDFKYDVEDTDGAEVPALTRISNLGGNGFGADGTLSHQLFSSFVERCKRFGFGVLECKGKLLKAGHVRRHGDTWFEIELNADHRPEQKFCTLCHELAHVFCGHLGPVKGLVEDRLPVDHDQRETEAELSAYLAARRFGITPASGEYIKWFSVPGEVPEFSLETVLVAVGKIEALLCGELRRKK